MKLNQMFQAHDFDGKYSAKLKQKNFESLAGRFRQVVIGEKSIKKRIRHFSTPQTVGKTGLQKPNCGTSVVAQAQNNFLQRGEFWSKLVSFYANIIQGGVSTKDLSIRFEAGSPLFQKIGASDV